MRKNYFVILAAILLLVAINRIAQAQDATGAAKGMPQVSKPVDAGNKICPVTGEKIDAKTKVTIEYEGKMYNLCCSACVDEFKKDPQKYIKKVEEELKSEAQKK